MPEFTLKQIDKLCRKHSLIAEIDGDNMQVDLRTLNGDYMITVSIR